MSALLYFFPSVEVLGRTEHIPESCQLSTVLDGATFAPVRIPAGPDAKAGMLIAVDPAPESGGTQAQLLFDGEAQEWTPIEDESGVVTHWIGYQLSAPPTARDLIRPKVSEGGLVELNGENWVVPLLSLPDNPLTSLPKRYVWKRGGVRQEVEDRYLDLRLRAQRQFDWFRKIAGEEDVDFADLWIEEYEQFYFAVDCLNVNYRVSGPEVCFLKLLNSQSILQVIRKALGLHFYDAQTEAVKRGF